MLLKSLIYNYDNLLGLYTPQAVKWSESMILTDGREEEKKKSEELPLGTF